jgi:hypothetical protein
MVPSRVSLSYLSSRPERSGFAARSEGITWHDASVKEFKTSAPCIGCVPHTPLLRVGFFALRYGVGALAPPITAKDWASALKIPLLNLFLNYENPPRSKAATTRAILSTF